MGIETLFEQVTAETSQAEKITLIRVEGLSDALKAEITKRLAEICHGAESVSEGFEPFSYRSTVREFLSRLAGKPEDHKKGCVGELLTHVILFRYLPNYQRSSVLFNLEEKSFKKGFDLVLFDKSQCSLWFVEVKSGSTKSGGVRSKVLNLTTVAASDIRQKLNNKDSNSWLNAMSHARAAIEANDIRKEVKKIISDCMADGSDSLDFDRNVILSSVAYENLSEQILCSDLFQKSSDLISQGDFSDFLIFSIRKETYEKVLGFLQEEAGE